jgi:hypothetical protein
MPSGMYVIIFSKFVRFNHSFSLVFDRFYSFVLSSRDQTHL